MIHQSKSGMNPKLGHSWHEKLHSPLSPRLVTVPDHWAETIGPGKMLIPTPELINTFLNKIPNGKLATVNLIREKFAHEYHAHTTCPLTTGIFLRIVAGAAEEDLAEGKKNITPYWRVLKEGGKLNPKYPGGVENQAEHLRSEGFEISEGKSENSWKVKHYEENLVDI